MTTKNLTGVLSLHFQPEAPARSDRIFGWIEEISDLAHYPCGAIIHAEQDAPSAIYLIYRGRVELSLSGTEGTVLGAGEFFGELRLNGGATARVYRAQVLEASDVWVLSRERVLGLLQHRPDLLAKLKGMVAYKQDLLFLFDE